MSKKYLKTAIVFTLIFNLLLSGNIVVGQNSGRYNSQVALHHSNFPFIKEDSTESPIAAPIIEFNFPTPKSGPSIVNIGKNGDVWVALARAGKIGCFKNGQIIEYALPKQSFPVGLTQDANGFVWYSDIRRNVIGKLNPQTGELKDFPIPTPESWAFSLAFDSKGKLWFTERVGNKIGKLDPITEKIEEFAIKTKGSQPAGLTVTIDDQVFFTQNSGHKVGHLDPVTGKLEEFSIPTPLKNNPFYGLAGITSDKNGNIWFSILDGKLGLIKKNGNKYEPVEEIQLPRSNTRPAGISVDKWNEVWFTELDGNSITNYNHEFKTFRTYPIPTGEPDRRPMGPPETSARGEIPMEGLIAKTSRPFGIAVDAQGSVWFSEQYAHKLGKLSPPKVEILSPSGITSDFLLEPQVRIRLDSKLPLKKQYLIDGKAVNQNQKNGLDISNIDAGKHLLTVVVTEKNGTSHSSKTEFFFNPTIASFKQTISQPKFSKEISLTSVKKIKELFADAEIKAQNGFGNESREIIRQVILDVENLQNTKPSGSLQTLLQNLRYFDTFGQRTYRVNISENESSFAPQTLQAEVGDTILWQKKAGLKNNRDDETELILETGGDFTKAKINAGNSFSHTFTKEGTYTFYDAKNPNVKGTVKIETRTTLIKEFPMLGADRVPGVLAIDEKNNIWFTMGGGGFSRLVNIPLNNKIGKLSPDGKITEFETPTIESGPTSIHVDKEGHIWFTERGGNKLGELNPEDGKITEYELPTQLSAATGITVAPDGRVWYAAKLSSKIGVLNPLTKEIKEYDTPSPKSQPSTITFDKEGRIWFDERANDRIVYLEPETGKMREYQVPTIGSRVVGLVPDDNGHVWFLELGANKVGRLDIETGVITEFSVPTKYSSPFKIARDSFGRIWFTQAFGNKIGVLLQNGKFYEFNIPTPDAMPGGIAIDPNGNVWFSEQAGNKLGLIPMGGSITPEMEN